MKYISCYLCLNDFTTPAVGLLFYTDCKKLSEVRIRPVITEHLLHYLLLRQQNNEDNDARLSRSV